jgi:sec-independent protein translocase protein TatA
MLPSLGYGEMIVVGVVAILLFGERLPEVARSFGKGFAEFKKSISGIQQQFDASIYSAGEPTSSSTFHPIDDSEEPSSIKFVPPSAEPQVAASETPSGAGEAVPAKQA